MSKEKITPPKRTAEIGKRHRRERTTFDITPVPAPDPKEIGTLTRYTEEVVKGGPRAVIAAEHKAARLAKKFGIELESKWCLTTPYVESLPARDKRYALAWRPRYLAVLSLSRSDVFACRAARISQMTTWRHRQIDPEFNEQCLEAEERAIQLLHDVTMKSAIEGETEPVYWQGIRCGSIRKIDNRLRIEMLRAHMPTRFKTPGNKVEINTGTQSITNNTMIVGPAERAELVEMRRASLRKIAEAKGIPIPAGLLA